jgi:hypothetical protein
MEADEEALMEVRELGIEFVYVCIFTTHSDHANSTRCMTQCMAYFLAKALLISPLLRRDI